MIMDETTQERSNIMDMSGSRRAVRHGRRIRIMRLAVALFMILFFLPYAAMDPVPAPQPGPGPTDPVPKPTEPRPVPPLPSPAPPKPAPAPVPSPIPPP
jgi:hypothetical protein